jgi:hypothetical protein
VTPATRRIEMAYDVVITNNYPWPLTLTRVDAPSTSLTLGPGQTGTVNAVNEAASLRIDVPGCGAVNLLTLGDPPLRASRHIPGDTTETWGVLITYQGVQVVGRYDGVGNSALTIDSLGVLQFGGNNMDYAVVEMDPVSFSS